MKKEKSKIASFFFDNIPLKLLALVLAVFTFVITSI